MKPTITLVVLCSALFIMLEAAPVLPNSGFETFEKQQFDEMIRVPEFLSKILTAGGNRAGRGGSIQADNELGWTLLNVVSSLLPATNKKAFPNAQEERMFFNGFNSILSLIGKQLGNEGGEIQSDDEMVQILRNLFGTLAKKIDNGEVRAQSAGNKEMERKVLNDARNFVAALSRKADPNREVIQTLINGANTILSLIEKQLDSGGEAQSSDSEVTQTFTNLAISFLSWLRKTLNDTYGEVQFANDDEFGRTVFNIAKTLFSAMHRDTSRANPNDEMVPKLYNWFDTMLPILADVGELDHERVQRVINQFGSLLSAMTKKIENGKHRIHFTSKAGPAIWKLFSNDVFPTMIKNIIDPNDDASLNFFNHVSTFLSAFGRMINGHGEGQIQSGIDNELLKTVLNFWGTINSDYLKKAMAKDIEFAQPMLTLFNAILSAVKNKIGGAQAVHMDTLPTYTDKHFDQSMSMESVDENAAMVEGDMDLSDEAKTQLWGATLRGLATGVLNK